MSESALSTSAAMLFERNDAQVLEAFRGGDFDYVDAIGEVSEADFFQVITERKILDNEHYEGSSRLLFDEQNHPVDSAKLTREQQKAYDWRRCYKLVTLLHTNRAGEFFLYGGLRLTAGKDHEAPVLYELVDEFVQCHGRGVMKRLILDRGFLDGEKIGHCKRDLGIDVLIPARKDLEIYKDVVGLAEGGLLSFQPVPRRKRRKCRNSASRARRERRPRSRHAAK